MPLFKSFGFGVLLLILALAMPEVFGALEDTFVLALETVQHILGEAGHMAAVGQPALPDLR